MPARHASSPSTWCASKLKLAEQFGATDLVDASKGDAVGTVHELTGGGVDHAFEAIGLKVADRAGLRQMLKNGGTRHRHRHDPRRPMVELHGFDFLLEKKIQGSNMGSNQFRIDMPRYVDMYLQGKLKLDELVSARIPLERSNQGFAAMKAGEIARDVIIFD